MATTTIAQLAKETAKEEAPVAPKDKEITIQLEDMDAHLLHRYRECKIAESRANPLIREAKSILEQLKAKIRDHVDLNYHGSTPPKKITLLGDGESVTMSASDKYGNKQMPGVFTGFKNGEDIRKAVGSEWFDEHVEDQSRIVMHAFMIKNDEVKGKFIEALSEFIAHWEGDGLIPKGTIQVEERLVPKSTFHQDRFALDLARHNALSEEVEMPLTVEKFRG